MTQLPSVGKSLTGDMDSSESTQQQRPLEATSRGQESRQLPSLRATLGKEITAKRQIAIGPKPVLQLFVPGVHEFFLDGLPIRTYQIGKEHYNMQQPPHEGTNEFFRRTVDNREIRYVLDVKQQPEKARACGSGNKSSNDRRPVDPPPVVELKVYTDGHDTSMTYDATFMLYASLELARPIAHGKMHAPTTIPVLAGVTVASAAYLEKPSRAAYFIFPDLSVRHEGWYRLRFSLFEGVKHDFDADYDKPFDHSARERDKLSPPVRHESVFNRMEVLSTPFQVYSAKKFPGLARSTPLSQLVADQGCRVRIRRDVRQRKRAQQKDDGEDDDASSSYQGTPRVTYPTLDHSRSASRNSLRSQYDQKESIDSLYGGPNHPSRQTSLSSYPTTSPVLPTPTSSMPPPSAYPYQLPRPGLATNFRSGQQSPLSDQSTFPRTITPDVEPRAYNNRLPPMQPGRAGEIRPDPFYSIPATSTAKRSYSPNDYGPQSLKSFSRPNESPSYSVHPTLNDDDIIEPDDNVDNENDIQNAIHDDTVFWNSRIATTGPLIFSRADGKVREARPIRRPSH